MGFQMVSRYVTLIVCVCYTVATYHNSLKLYVLNSTLSTLW